MNILDTPISKIPVSTIAEIFGVTIPEIEKRIEAVKKSRLKRPILLTKDLCANCGNRILHDSRYMLDASDKNGQIWCSAECQNMTMGWGKAQAGKRQHKYYMLRCQYKPCQKRFKAKRRNARFCSNRHQRAAKRRGN